LSRIPRSSLFYFLLIIVLGFVFWFTWQQFESGSKGDQWSYSKLVNSAQAGQVRSVEIKGAARGNVILQKQIFGAVGRPPFPGDFITVKASEAVPFASVIGRLASGGSGPVDFRVRTGGDFTGNPEFG